MTNKYFLLLKLNISLINKNMCIKISKRIRKKMAELCHTERSAR